MVVLRAGVCEPTLGLGAGAKGFAFDPPEATNAWVLPNKFWMNLTGSSELLVVVVVVVLVGTGPVVWRRDLL
jgi:hypothetical protein